MPQRKPIGSISVVGLGPMGQAVVRAFLDAGVTVTVWNRSTEKADTMVELGARRAATVREVLDANDLIVVSLTHYAAMYDALGQASDHLAGKVIANLSSDSPASTREAAAWVRSHGGDFLAGGVMAQSDGLTDPESYVFYAGRRAVFEAHRDLLSVLNTPEYLGEDEGLAQLYYQAVLAIFNPLLLGVEQALAMIDRSGEPIDRFLPYAQRSLGRVDDVYAGLAASAQAGGLGDVANLQMMAAGARHVLETSEAVGVDTALARTVQSYWHRAIAESGRRGELVPTFAVLRGDHA
ncbi:NAD(P)-dependent oxidoreductase [Nocardia suismassiliense]|uniref:NAD(P)-dependent oxidoreductase n=1 Tax=Nocardia suismassiliense TaxID=2077092 RepID=UPI000D1EAF97|nr:NAD(P)-binding domain-containing protein [Nocardia suismassiliense]